MALAQAVDYEYIPRTILFSPPEVMMVKISPDSQHLAYVLAQPSGVMNIHISPAMQISDRKQWQQITNFTVPEIYRFFWLDDSKHIVFLQDTNGSKIYDLYSVDVHTRKLVNHTQDFKASAKIFAHKGSKVALGLNDRNPQYHDIFILDLANGSLERIFENDKFSRFTFDENLQPIFKEQIHDDGSIDIYKDASIYMHFSAEDAFHSRFLRIERNVLYYLDTRDSDTTQLKAVDLKTDKQRKIAHDLKSDIADITFIDAKPVLYSTTWLKKQWHELAALSVAHVQKELGTEFKIVSQSKNYLVIRSVHPQKIGASFYLYDIEKSKLTPVYLAPTHEKLADMIGFEFQTRDGLTLTAYITLPDKIKSIADVKHPVPLIIVPHGGPFQVRDVYTYHPYHQWLASRGYAVLSVNFRLSSGLGKNLVNAGNGQWGGKAQYDLLDAANWCIEQGITTKDKIGIMGGSYGGYSTLAGLAFTPNDFAVGVDIVGPSSLITVMQGVPKYWDFPAYPLSDEELFFTKGAFIKSMGGSPEDAEGRKFLASRSPLNFVQQIKSPVLIVQGDNDPIVTKKESDQIFAQLKELHKNVRYISFPDEGHQFRRYANIDVYLANAEQWLHEVLGGKCEPMTPQYLKESSIKIAH